ncbi:hypothetical protein DENSPDRAFT_877559 [Dentipellis sp. KUC8613]|nr:hypothetical protein DENSPDRAFT_877559 [Dentipellis sp. KUC8613]
MSAKRALSEEECSAPSGATKKAKVATAPPAFPTDPVCISAIRWYDEGVLCPLLWFMGNGPEPYGAYHHAIRPTRLIPSSWSDEHEAFTYKLPPPQNGRSRYNRSTYIGTLSSEALESGAVFGDADDQDPLLLVHRPLPPNAASAFRATFDRYGYPEEDQKAPSDKPPSIYEAEAQYFTNIGISVPSHASIVHITMPDLESHRAAMEDRQDAESSEEEEDEHLEPGADQCSGVWTGKWSRIFIARAKAGLPLPHLDKVIWDYNHVWGVKVRLVPLADSITTDRIPFSHDDRTGKLRLESYRIQATVQEVYVKPEFFDEVEVPVDEEEEEETDSEVYEEV